MPYATVDDLAEYLGDNDLGLRERRAEVALATAGGMVAVASSVPAEPAFLADYKAAALNAELMAAEYLFETKGYKSSTSKGVDVLSKSDSYRDASALEGMLAGALGSYYVPPNKRSKSLMAPVPITGPPRGFGRAFR